jgi:D-amino-acid dehydrogenase
MKIAVIGAGIVGVTTAYELATDGHAVTVIEQRGTIAEEGSFAGAGLVAPSQVALAGSVASNAARQFRTHWPPAIRDMRWLWRRRSMRRSHARAAHHEKLQQLAFYSRERLRNLTSNLQLEYDRSEGTLLLLRTPKDAARAEEAMQCLRAAGISAAQLSAAGARQIEPGLNPQLDFAGALHFADDDVANCRQFALLLKAQAQTLGVQFVFNTTVRRLLPNRPATLKVTGDDTAYAFDAVVVCAGPASADLLRPLGLALPLAPVHLYSVTAAMREPLAAPVSAVIDAHHQVTISRLGRRIRVAGGAELGGSVAHKREATIQTLYTVLNDWFPGGAQLANSSVSVQLWKGALATLPDGLPIIGGSGLPGLWLNLGHGEHAWALSCASARVIADLIAGNAPNFEADSFRVDRVGKPPRA